jgi:hypothetical protein
MPGEPGNEYRGGGRPKNSRTRLSKKFVDTLLADFEVHGAGIVKVLRVQHPDKYCQLIGSLVPREVDLEVTNRAVEVREWMSWVVQSPSILQPIAKSDANEPPPLAHLSKPEPPPRLRHEPFNASEAARNEPIVEKPRLQLTPRQGEKKGTPPMQRRCIVRSSRPPGGSAVGAALCSARHGVVGPRGGSLVASSEPRAAPHVSLSDLHVAPHAAFGDLRAASDAVPSGVCASLDAAQYALCDAPDGVPWQSAARQSLYRVE